MSALIVNRRAETIRVVALTNGTGATLSVHADNVGEDGGRVTVEPLLMRRELLALVGQIGEALDLDIQIRPLRPEIVRALGLVTAEGFTRELVA